MNYRLAYSIGFHPWEDAETEPEFVATIDELFSREEMGREPLYGRALGQGCGSGIWGVRLAKRGWQVTGVGRSTVLENVSRTRALRCSL